MGGIPGTLSLTKFRRNSGHITSKVEGGHITSRVEGGHITSKVEGGHTYIRLAPDPIRVQSLVWGPF